jgi:Xaa-Pro aminopeptidase
LKRNLFTVERIDRLRWWAAQNGLDGLLLRKRGSFAWLTMGRCNHIVWTTEEGVADLLIFPDRAFCVTTRMESDRIEEEELAGLGFEMIASEWTEGVLPTLHRLCAEKKSGPMYGRMH